MGRKGREGRVVGEELGRGEYVQNVSYEILQDLIKILLKKDVPPPTHTFG